MFNLYKYEIASRWISILGWGIGLTLFASIYIGIYPDMAEEMANLADLSIYQAMGIDIATFAGFIASVVGQIFPTVIGVYVIMMATGTLAGEEEDGTLETIVAMPLERWQIVLMKTLGLLTVTLLIMLIFSIGSALVLQSVIDSVDVVIDVQPMELFTALIGTYPLMVAIFGISLFLGAFMPSRRLALVVMFAFYLASYLANSISGMVASMEWVEPLSLFSYINTSASVFETGADVGDTTLLLVIGSVFIGLAIWSFQGRNITVGQWIWERGRIPSQS